MPRIVPKPEIEQIPLKFLTDPSMCSHNVLGEYQMRHLDKAAHIEKEIRRLVTAYLAEMTASGFALWLREHRQELIERCSTLKAE